MANSVDAESDMDSSISEFGHIHRCKEESKINNKMANSVDAESDMDSSISEFGHIHRCKEESKINNKMANSVDADEVAPYEPSHLDRHCLQR